MLGKNKAKEMLRKIGVLDEVIEFLKSKEAREIMRKELKLLEDIMQTDINPASEELKPVLMKLKQQVIENEEVFFSDIEDTFVINFVKLFEGLEKNRHIYTTVVEEVKRELQIKDRFVMYILEESAKAVGVGTNKLFIIMAAEFFLSHSE